jgi:hypothetical protein
MLNGAAYDKQRGQLCHLGFILSTPHTRQLVSGSKNGWGADKCFHSNRSLHCLLKPLMLRYVCARVIEWIQS